MNGGTGGRKAAGATGGRGLCPRSHATSQLRTEVPGYIPCPTCRSVLQRLAACRPGLRSGMNIWVGTGMYLDTYYKAGESAAFPSLALTKPIRHPIFQSGSAPLPAAHPCPTPYLGR